MHWEFESHREMLTNLVGFYYGDTPESEIKNIVQDRENLARILYQKMFLSTEDIGLEIGSGCGHLSRPIAEKVRFLHCADVSQSFLDSAQEHCSQLNNMAFHKIKTGQLDFLKDNSLDFAFAHAVFIHFNLYDIYWYLKELHKKLKPTGRICFDFLCTEDLDIIHNEHFKTHADDYRNDPSSFPMFLKYNSREAVLKMAEEVGFEVFAEWRGPNCNVEILLIKSNSPKQTRRKAKISTVKQAFRWGFDSTYELLVKLKICPIFNRQEKLRKWKHH